MLASKDPKRFVRSSIRHGQVYVLPTKMTERLTASNTETKAIRYSDVKMFKSAKSGYNRKRRLHTWQATRSLKRVEQIRTVFAVLLLSHPENRRTKITNNSATPLSFLTVCTDKRRCKYGRNLFLILHHWLRLHEIIAEIPRLSEASRRGKTQEGRCDVHTVTSESVMIQAYRNIQIKAN